MEGSDGAKTYVLNHQHVITPEAEKNHPPPQKKKQKKNLKKNLNSPVQEKKIVIKIK